MEYGFIFNLLLQCFIVPYLDASRCITSQVNTLNS
jgi:hypothetical protein